MTDLINAAIGLAVVAGLAWFLIVRGRRKERERIEQDDMEHAEDIRRRVDRADERLRDFDDAGWRD